jgi:branched-chain amino acid transport system permease protein
MRAISKDIETTRLMGVSVNRIIAFTSESARPLPPRRALCGPCAIPRSTPSWAFFPA